MTTPRSVRLHVLLSRKEMAAVKRLADANGGTVSEWIRAMIRAEAAKAEAAKAEAAK